MHSLETIYNRLCMLQEEIESMIASDTERMGVMQEIYAALSEVLGITFKMINTDYEDSNDEQ